MAAIDFSKYSQNVVAVAVDLAQKLNAELIFVNVINQRDLNAVEQTLQRMSVSGGSLSISDYVAEMMDNRSENMKTLLENAGWKNSKVDYLIFKKGVPFEQLVKAVHKENADLVVMGNKGRSNLSGVLFGSTAEKMFRHCPVTLLSVREKKTSRVIW
jgi:nucleotide-binding universal stress UspA family protein